MVTIIFQSIIFLTALMSLFGCAGISANAGSNFEMIFRPRVQEKFNFNIQSEAVRKELKMVHTKNLSPGNALEIKILQKIAVVLKKEELQTVFDSMWENDEVFRSVLNHPDRTDEFIPSLALTYYLLSSSGTSWQKETSERLYRDVFQGQELYKLTGYTLHFYTLALLNNGKYKDSLPWLNKLREHISLQDYTDNLQKAFIMSESGMDYETAIRLLSKICMRKAENHEIKINEPILDFSVISLIKKGYKNNIKTELEPILKKYPNLMKISFIRRITEQNIIQASTKPSLPADIWIKVQVIRADNRSDFIDPDLLVAKNELQNKLAFTSLELINSQVFHFEKGNKIKMKILPKIYTNLRALDIKDNTSRLEILISKYGKTVFKTIIESTDGGVTTISGPRSNGSLILLRMTTFNQDQF